MGWIFRTSVGFVAILASVSFVGTRWNARGGVFDPVPSSKQASSSSSWAVVTGANSGLGFSVAQGLSSLGFHVIMGVRNVGAGEEAKRRFTHKKGEVVVLELDQSSLASVRSFSANVKKQIGNDSLDALVLNAGIWANQGPSKDGIPLTAQVNHYAGFLLANLLLPKMNDDRGRIVIVSSLMSKSAVDFRNDLLLQNSSLMEGRGDQLYGTSKLFNILHAQALSKRTKVKVNSVHPGIFKTDLHREENEPVSARFITNYIAPIFYGIIGISTDDAAKSSLFLATEVESTGKFYHGMLPRTPPTPLSENLDLEEMLWKKSEEITK